MADQLFHSHPVQIRFSDIDVLGHTTNSIYQQYFDLGRMHYFIDVLKEQMDWKKEGLILVNTSVSFLDQIRLYDKIEVRTKVIKLGNKSLEILQQLYNLSNKTIAAEGKSVMVGYSGKLGASIPLPSRWRERIIKFERDISFEL